MNEQEWLALRNKANQVADEVYSTEASNIIRLTKSEVEKVVDEAGVNKEKLAELMAVVNSSAKSNRQKADAVRNTVGLAEIAVAILKIVS